jgi:hypothetical protein
MRFPQKVLLSFAAVAACGLSMLALPVHVVNLQRQLAVAPIPEPLPIPREKQNWTNADRGCLSWTASHDKSGQATTVTPRKIDGPVAADRAKLPAIRGRSTIT